MPRNLGAGMPASVTADGYDAYAEAGVLINRSGRLEPLHPGPGRFRRGGGA
ncbi:hypothetical protein ACRAWD_21440 [Caulobacter segnis]